MFTAEELAQILQALHATPSTIGAAMAFRPIYDKVVHVFDQVKNGGRRVALITQEEHDLIRDYRAPKPVKEPDLAPVAPAPGPVA